MGDDTPQSVDSELRSAVSKASNLILGFTSLLTEAAKGMADSNGDKTPTENDKTHKPLAVMTNGEWIRNLYSRLFYK